MNKKIDKTLITSSIICILPIILSIILYNKLPDKIPIHFDLNGEPDSYSSKFFAAIMLPIILFFANILFHILIKNDPKKQNHPQFLLEIIKFIIPITSIIFVPITLLISLGINLKINIIALIFASIILIVIGNYLPKCKQNYTMGIRIPWTLNDENNWVKTHRLAGFLFVISGFLILISSFINNVLSFYILIFSLILSSIIPYIYSFILYKKSKKT